MNTDATFSIQYVSAGIIRAGTMACLIYKDDRAKILFYIKEKKIHLIINGYDSNPENISSWLIEIPGTLRFFRSDGSKENEELLAWLKLVRERMYNYVKTDKWIHQTHQNISFSE